MKREGVEIWCRGVLFRFIPNQDAKHTFSEPCLPSERGVDMEMNLADAVLKRKLQWHLWFGCSSLRAAVMSFAVPLMATTCVAMSCSVRSFTPRSVYDSCLVSTRSKAPVTCLPGGGFLLAHAHSRAFSPPAAHRGPIVEQIVEGTVPQNLKEIVELVRWTSATEDRRVNVDVPVPQIIEEMSRYWKNVLQGWISERIREQIVGQPAEDGCEVSLVSTDPLSDGA